MLAEIQNHLAGHPWQDKIIWLECIDSTNTYAKQLARTGAPEGTIVIADQQTGGRGRPAAVADWAGVFPPLPAWAFI